MSKQNMCYTLKLFPQIIGTRHEMRYIDNGQTILEKQPQSRTHGWTDTL